MIEKFEPSKHPNSFAYFFKRYAEGKRCSRCGKPVLRSDIEGYSFQCLNCDEDLFGFEVVDGEKATEEELNELCVNLVMLRSLD